MTDRIHIPGKRSCLSLGMIVGLAFCTGCAHVNVRQLAYEMLSQEDCRRNQLDDFCTRTFAREYLEYERIRQEFLRNQTQRTWRASRNFPTLSGTTS